MRVEQLMNQPAVVCRANDTLNTAAHLMWQNDCGAVPVVNDHGTLVGMITDRDICMAAYTTGRRLAEVTVTESMSHQVISCAPGDDVEDAERRMADSQIRRLPVVDDERRPIGVLSVNDLARHGASARDRNHVLQTLATICQPRDVELLPRELARA